MGRQCCRALPTLLPNGGFVYFEGTTERSFAAWLRAHAAAVPFKIAHGTFWPRPDFFHLPLDRALLEEGAAVIDRHGIAFPSIHVHAHDGSRVLLVLAWHDAFADDPMYVASEIPRETVEAFASRMHVGPVSRVGDTV